MKNIYRFLTLVLVTAFITGCDNNDDGPSFANDPTTGWVQFVTGETDPVFLDFVEEGQIIEIPVFTQVPIIETDLSIEYSLQSSSGDASSVYPQNSLLVPAGTGGTAIVDGYPIIDFDLAPAMGIDTPLIFDVVLEDTNILGVGIGLADSDRPTSHTVSICPSLASSGGVALGDYVLTIETDEGPFGAQFPDGSIVTLEEGDDGEFSRVFTASYLGAVNIDIPFTFTEDGVDVADSIGTGLGCSSQIVIGGGDQEDQAEFPCGDDVIKINLLDFKNGSGGCGQADVETTIVLTKV